MADPIDRVPCSECLQCSSEHKEEDGRKGGEKKTGRGGKEEDGRGREYRLFILQYVISLLFFPPKTRV